MTVLLLTLLVGYGIAFGMQNKLPERLYSGDGLLARLLSCSYCSGFHAGWMAWALMNVFEIGYMPIGVIAVQSIAHAFAVAVVSLVLDNVVRTLSITYDRLDVED
jgi:hypothetical protein